MSQFSIIFSIILFGIVLQIFLSNRANPYLGFIVPILHFIASLLVALFLTDILSAFIGFIVSSIPTVINLLIYRQIRKKIRRKETAAMNRMKIDDL